MLTQYLDWRWTLYVNLFFAGIAIVGTQILLVRERGIATSGLDFVSTMLISSGLFGVVYGLSHAATVATTAQATGSSLSLGSAFSNLTTILCILVGLVLVGAFVLRQGRVDRPMLPLGVVTDRARGGSFFGIGIAAASMFAVFLFLTYYLQYVLGYSPVKTGVSFLPMVGVLITASVISQTVLLPRFGPRPLVPTGMALGAVGMFFFAHISASGSYTTQVLPGLLLAGIGIGMVFSTAMNTATARVPAEYAGAASAAVNVFQQVGGSLGTALLSTVSISALVAFEHAHQINRDRSQGGPVTAMLSKLAQVHGYSAGFTWGMAMFIIGAVVTLVILPSGKPQRAAVERELVAV